MSVILIISFNLEDPGFAASSPSDTQPVSTPDVSLGYRRRLPDCLRLESLLAAFALVALGGCAVLLLLSILFCFNSRGAVGDLQNRCDGYVIG